MVDLPVASRSRLVAYLAALGAVALAAVVDLALLPWITPSVTPAFLLAVAIAAYYGGFLPGIAAAVTNRLSSDAGSSHFQANPISWSMRTRGSVPRIHTKTNTKT